MPAQTYDILLAGLVNDEGTALRPARKPGFSLFTERSNQNFALSMQGEQSKTVTLKKLQAIARQHQARFAALDDGVENLWNRSIAKFLYDHPDIKYDTLLEELGTDRAKYQLTTLVALSYFYRVSSTGVNDHKAVFSIRMLSDLLEAGIEGFLFQEK